MKRILASTLLALTAQAAWYNQASTNLITSTYFDIDYDYNVALDYTSTYNAGEGPYYNSAIYTALDNTMHYEEYGFDTNLWAEFEIDFIVGNSRWEWDVILTADVFDYKPYRQTVWWTRFLAELV